MQYFKIETIEKSFAEKRGHYMTITIDKADGSERELSGVLCYGKGQFMINEGDVDAPAFKCIPHNRVKSVRYNQVIFKPKQ